METFRKNGSTSNDLTNGNNVIRLEIESREPSLDWEFIPDSEFVYLGFTDHQIRLLRDQPNDLRRIVYLEGLRLLMENGPGYGNDPSGNLNI